MALKRSPTDNTVSNCKKLKMYNALEPDFINYISVPSLESMSIVSIVTVLCKQSAIQDTIRGKSTKFHPKVGDGSFDEIEEKIMNNLVHLALPNVLKTEVSNAVRPIQLQILHWVRYERKDMDSICWSKEGTIDKIKTLIHLIDKDTCCQHVQSNYKLACNSCSEESARNLWNKLPEETRKHYLCSKDIYVSYDNHLLAYWSHYISSNLPELFEKIRPNDKKRVYNVNNSINKNMFKLALFAGNFLAVQYFWNKLTFVEISCGLKYWIKFMVNRRESSVTSYQYQAVCENAGILYFLLSKTNSKTEQNEILQKNPNRILNSLFFDWPWQRFLLPTINLLWEYIDAEYYLNLLRHIAWYIDEKKTTEHLFCKLWSDSPVNLKKHFIQNVLNKSYFFVFLNLLVVEKVGIIKEMLEYANLEDQKKIIFALAEDYNFLKVVRSDKLDLFGDLWGDLLSQSDIKCIKERIVCRHFNGASFKWIKSNEWDKIKAFLNWAFDTEERVEHFKNETMKKVELTHCLIETGNYEFVNKFLSWCFGSETKIHEFKIYFAKSKPEIVEIGYEDWHLFENFVDWCFNSDEEIQNFKLYFKFQSHKIWRTIFSCIAFGYRFDFVENLIKWCFNSHEEIKEFKENLALSKTWMNLLQRFVSNYKCYDSDWNNWELIKKLLKLVSPLEEDVINKMKERIESDINFDNFYGDYKKRSFMVQKKDLFRLLDKDSYDINDEDCSSSDDSESSNDGGESSDSADGENGHNVSNFDNEIALILTEILNNVENGLQVDKS